jgi:hypothetical protein
METQRQIEYRAYLSTEHWINKRLSVLKERGCKCEKCGEYGNEIHHLSYEHLWDEPLNELQVLCRDCHEATHAALKSLYPRERKKEKKMIHRRALFKALTLKHKTILCEKHYLYEEELYAYILYSNEKKHRKIINEAAELLGFDGFHPKMVRQANNRYNSGGYKKKPVRKPMKLM